MGLPFNEEGEEKKESPSVSDRGEKRKDFISRGFGGEKILVRFQRGKAKLKIQTEPKSVRKMNRHRRERSRRAAPGPDDGKRSQFNRPTAGSLQSQGKGGRL